MGPNSRDRVGALVMGRYCMQNRDSVPGRSSVRGISPGDDWPTSTQGCRSRPWDGSDRGFRIDDLDHLGVGLFGIGPRSSGERTTRLFSVLGTGFPCSGVAAGGRSRVRGAGKDDLSSAGPSGGLPGLPLRLLPGSLRFRSVAHLGGESRVFERGPGQADHQTNIVRGSSSKELLELLA